MHTAALIIQRAVTSLSDSKLASKLNEMRLHQICIYLNIIKYERLNTIKQPLKRAICFGTPLVYLGMNNKPAFAIFLIKVITGKGHKFGRWNKNETNKLKYNRLCSRAEFLS